MEVEWRDQVDDVTGVAVQHQCDLNVNRCEQKTHAHTCLDVKQMWSNTGGEGLTLSSSAQNTRNRKHEQG